MPVYYTNRVRGRVAELDEEESRHIVRVLRMKAGDPLDLVDGRGNFYRGIIQSPDPSGTRVSILEARKDHLTRNHYLHLAIAPTKNSDRFEWFLEKATEIGVDEISPLICTRSERERIRLDRSQKILLAAMKQSGRAFLPSLHPPVSLQDLLDAAAADHKYIAHCGSIPRRPLYGLLSGFSTAHPGIRAKQPVASADPVSTAGKPSWLVLIGPEGDFTEEEVTLAMARGYESVSLGEATFRTETAGVLACVMVNLLAGQ